MGHYSSAPRRWFVVIHHAGSANSHKVRDGRFCESGYDFTVDRDGRIYVCRNNADTFYRWKKSIPSGQVWHASGCDCKAMGICMHGCFGGCNWGNIKNPSPSQKCAVAYLIAHLKTPDKWWRHRPHAACSRWNPCNHPNPITTVCPGERFTGGGTGWNWRGENLRDEIRKYRRNWDNYGCCEPPCPV